MRFYIKQHRFYCGIDLHTRFMYVCILNQEGEVVFHRNMRTKPQLFLKAIAPFGEDIIVGVECMFAWYWLADLCSREGIPFVLGHALYKKAIHGAKVKNDRIDARKIAALLRGGMFPTAYAYPAQMRGTRNLLRRRNYLMRKRAELLSHIQNTNSQCNLPEFGTKISYKIHHGEILEQFADPDVRRSIEVDLELIDHYDRLLGNLERYILGNAPEHDPHALYLLRTVHGIGRVRSLVILYEIHDIHRFPRVQYFASYARLVRCAHESAGKRAGKTHKKIGAIGTRPSPGNPTF
ncbi:MAG: IS110 family transposase [Candidatus Eisenbacteria sp.]|nr:IS110 family transposase [Candidatus Eisenbacteria bacterium]